MEHYSNYLNWMAGCVAAILFCSVTFVAVIDPYNLYGLVRVQGLNDVKYRPTRYQDEIKLTGALREEANAVILGNSRAEIGFDPMHPGFEARGLRAYNLAIPGTSITTGCAQLTQMIKTGHTPKVVILGIEFLDFLIAPDYRWQDPCPDHHGVDKLEWRINTLFALASLDDAWHTVRIQKDPAPKTLTDRGFNPLLEYAEFARADGYFALFQQRAQENAKRFAGKSHALVTADGRSPDFEALRAIMRMAKAQDFELHIVIYPYHAQVLLMFEEVGIWPLFEAWKSRLVRETIDAPHTVLWDFSGYSGPRCEPIPARNDRTTIPKWYWEAGHFKRDLGNLVLAQILQPSRQKTGIGVPLRADNLVGDLARLATEREACLTAQSTLRRDVHELVQPHLKQVHTVSASAP